MMAARGAAVKRCVECGTVFESSGQYRYRNGWKAAPICRAVIRCQERKGHDFRPCRVSTAEGVFVTCGYVGCGYATHMAQAALS